MSNYEAARKWGLEPLQIKSLKINMFDHLPFFSVNKGTLIHLEHEGKNAIFSLCIEQRYVEKEDEDEAIISKLFSYTCQ